MFVIGTAGHIDHGKTSLIRYLTNLNPDRLKEEQERGITIDLGFAWRTLPSGISIGIIDVPGHHRFIKNMLAGVGGIDLTLLVIAADDGVMPQTKEHVEILDLLGIKRGIVVLTKADLVEEDWLDLVQEEIREYLKKTSLRDAPIIPVSSLTGWNMEYLLHTLDELLKDCPPTPNDGNPLLWIDRVFSIRGSGTVVTGTLLGGTLSLGQEVHIQPIDLKARIRGLENHQARIEVANPGSRLAVNLVGIDKSELTRGMYLSLPQKRPGYSLVNAYISLLPDVTHGISNMHSLKLYTGTLETDCLVKLLDSSLLQAKEEGFVQIELATKAHFSFKSPFVLRDATLGETLGGGVFLEEGLPLRGKLHRIVGVHKKLRAFAFEKQAPLLQLSDLKEKLQANPAAYPALLAEERPFWVHADYVARVVEEPMLPNLSGYVMGEKRQETLKHYLLDFVTKHHETHPLSLGIPKETLRNIVDLPPRLFAHLVKETKGLKETQGVIHKEDHEVRLNEKDKETWQNLEAWVNSKGYAPPTKEEILGRFVSPALLSGLLELGLLVLLPENHITTEKVLADLKTLLSSFSESFSLGEFRDALNSSRKYALLLLEYLDEKGVTLREGETRRLRKT